MILLTVVILAVAATASAKDLPDFIHICKRNDPNIDACVLESTNFLRPYLAKGIPEMNVPALEPLILDELVAVQGNGLKVSAKNVKAYGASDFVASNLKMDLEKMTIAAEVFIPNLYVTGTYFIDGKLLGFPLKGSGDMKMNLTDVKGSVFMKGEVRKNEAGEDVGHCNDLEIKVLGGNGRIHLDNILGGDATLDEAINAAVNSNFQELFKAIAPLAAKALAISLKTVTNNIVGSFTFQQLLPES